MRGRPGCPTGQKKNSVGATAGSPLFLFLQGKVGYRIAPSSAPVCALGHLPPKGKALGVGASLSDYNTHPSQPAQPGGGPLRAWDKWAAGQAEKKRTPYRILQTRVGSPEGRTSPLWPSFPPFLGRNGGPRRVGALRGAAPRGFEKAPTTQRVRSTPPPPAGGAAPSHVSGSGSPRMVASGWKMAQKKSLSRARISRSSR